MESKNTEIANKVEFNDNTESILALKQESIEHFQGPLPSPEVLSQYENLCPGTAERIILMAEVEQAHRHKTESKMVGAESRDSLLGIVCATVLGMMCAVVGASIAVKIKSNCGILTGGLVSATGIGSIVGTFLKGTMNSWKNRSQED